MKYVKKRDKVKESKSYTVYFKLDTLKKLDVAVKNKQISNKSVFIDSVVSEKVKRLIKNGNKKNN